MKANVEPWGRAILEGITRENQMYACLMDTNGQMVGEMFSLKMQYDQSRNAFTNQNVPVVVADRSVVATTVHIFAEDGTTQVAKVALDRMARLMTGDSVSFQQNGINLGMDHDVIAPGLYEIEEEACIEDAF